MAEPPSFRYDLTVMGPPSLRGSDGRVIQSITAQPKRLGLLTYLVLAGDPVPRSRLMALFWPESDEGKARNALNQSVFYLRRSLDTTAVQSTEPDSIGVGGGVFRCDARRILDEDGVDSADIAALHRGPLLDGWGGSASNALNDWLDQTRERLDRIVVRRSLDAARQLEGSDPTTAASWALRATELRPWDPATGLEAASVLVVVGRSRAARDLADALERDMPEAAGVALSEDWKRRFDDVLEGSSQRPAEASRPSREPRPVGAPGFPGESASSTGDGAASNRANPDRHAARPVLPVWRVAGAFLLSLALVGLSGSALTRGGGNRTDSPVVSAPGAARSGASAEPGMSLTPNSIAAADQWLVVLIPRVDTGESARSLDANNIFTAIKALLPASPHNTIAALGVANSLTGLRGQLETVGIPGRGTLVIETVVRVTGEQAVLNAFVHRYHTSALLDRVTAPFPIDGDTDLLLELPDQLAGVVGELAARWTSTLPDR